ncbi:aminotransferase class V-fold PLP-dependent enzyme [Dehalobacterium formicoaceticum]|uniref:aminotransferase class V-fold PLP-dependent enzyme n=1 Tax=Dehalobacterium formicoaceticum TaxID=51515 RepID=UPI0012FBEDEC|nr:aminotransferase class V-fold PLP-dependent enzyme [Dehalobacterium formicoaceticum]
MNNLTEQNRFIIKIADQKTEFELIHRLNYQTFVEEIPQHLPNEDRRLVDKFHNENTYIICLDGEKLVGSIAVRGNRPFSLDEKIDHLDSYFGDYENLCEIRLLMMDRKYRRGYVFYYLADALARYCLEKKYDCALMSGTTRQLKLYQHIGFVPFHHLIGKEGAYFQPMYITVENFAQGIGRLFHKKQARQDLAKRVNLLPGPVEIHPAVKAAYVSESVSHRGEVFLKDFHDAQNMLCTLVNARKVELFTGSGTLANEVVAAQLSLIGKKGLILAAGEFGERLIQIAERWGLDFQAFQKTWGETFIPEEIIEFMDQKGEAWDWLWTVHCESSTGVLLDLHGLSSLCQNRGMKLCLDAVSSIAAVPVDLSRVYLASGASGKAIGSLAGIAMVFYNHEIKPSHKIPIYLDLGYYHEKFGVPFTISSNLVYALKKAVQLLLDDHKFEKRKKISLLIRKELKTCGLEAIVPESWSSPAIITCALPQGVSSQCFGDIMEQKGYHLSFRSSYLIEKNWIQICLMGEVLLDEMKLFCTDVKASLKEMRGN